LFEIAPTIWVSPANFAKLADPEAKTFTSRFFSNLLAHQDEQIPHF
jgi:hypothetical protein